MSEQTKELMIIYKDNNGSEIKLNQKIVQDFITGGQPLSLPEFKFFTELCKIRKLNPFMKEVYAVKYSKDVPAQVVVSKDVFVERANSNPMCNGIEEGIIVLSKDGEIKERAGTFKLKEEIIVGGWAKIHRKNWDIPVYATVDFDEVSGKKKDGNLNSSWATKPATMVAKCALVRAIRIAFPDEFKGMYSEEELDLMQKKSPQEETYQDKKSAAIEVIVGEAEIIEEVIVEEIIDDKNESVIEENRAEQNT